MADIAEIMSSAVRVIGPEASIGEAARLMRDLDVGALPVCADKKLLGMVTDRDITVRGVAEGLGPETACVSDVMTGAALFCTADQDSEEVLRLMAQHQLRRLPVVNIDKELVGIVSIADLALRQSGPVDEAVRSISEPATQPAGMQAAVREREG
ncbi:CBS domain-containing protein [Roseateles violae]|uniref:CBS domain-containing protein n=1 Tax=Roseateles violae TaxID=3058042 RepID=A0ABT8E0G2_9BURK|nr:CBS domain-containing protein [Pelomonas sp. PFR6]MDN3923307.1 CBS domain-containing protein [Pelomonas sp. PFR6]